MMEGTIDDISQVRTTKHVFATSDQISFWLRFSKSWHHESQVQVIQKMSSRRHSGNYNLSVSDSSCVCCVPDRDVRGMLNNLFSFYTGMPSGGSEVRQSPSTVTPSVWLNSTAVQAKTKVLQQQYLQVVKPEVATVTQRDVMSRSFFKNLHTRDAPVSFCNSLSCAVKLSSVDAPLRSCHNVWEHFSHDPPKTLSVIFLTMASKPQPSQKHIQKQMYCTLEYEL